MSNPGILERHSRTCATTSGDPERKCSCRTSIQAWAYDRRSGKKLTKNFGNGTGARTAAKQWRSDVLAQLNRGTLQAPTGQTLNDAAEAWLEGAKAGTIRNRSGDIFKPSVIRSYESSLKLRVLPAIGARKLSDIRRVELQDLADRWLGEGLDPSTIRNTLVAVRVVFRRAVSRGELAVNPTTQLELPAVTGRRERIATADEASSLLSALPEADQALWATAMYAGLRRGELRGLRWEDVDLAAGLIHVLRSWDDVEGAVDTKSRAGRRDVPIVAALRSYLVKHRLSSGRSEGFVFGRSAIRTFIPSNVRLRAATAWKKENEKRKECEEETGEKATLLEPIGLHEARHTFASLLIAAGVNVKAISNYMGHSSITITLDRYGHLMPGHEAEAVAKIDAYLGAAKEATGV